MNREEATAILSTVSYRGWRFFIQSEDGRMWLQVQFQADGSTQRGRKWTISSFMTKSELVQTALKAVLTAEEHEAREHFRYRGRAIFSPHFDIDELYAIADGKHEETRPTPSFLADPMVRS